MNATFRIGEVAAKAGVPTPTLRFYERRGLVQAPARRSSGYRAYPGDTVGRVRFIKRAQEVGFSLTQVAELLQLRDGRRECAVVKRAAQAKLADVEAKIQRLIQMRTALQTLVASCHRTKSDACPILAAFEEENAT
jgi:MerR family transcriptional regulator, copper efflux regulator